MVGGIPARKGRDAEVETLELPLYGEQVEPDPALIELIAQLVVAQSRVRGRLSNTLIGFPLR